MRILVSAVIGPLLANGMEGGTEGRRCMGQLISDRVKHTSGAGSLTGQVGLRFTIAARRPVIA